MLASVYNLSLIWGKVPEVLASVYNLSLMWGKVPEVLASVYNFLCGEKYLRRLTVLMSSYVGKSTCGACQHL